MEQITFYKLRTVNYQSRLETYEGKQYMVFPVVMMVQGVHHGSGGALFHPIDELGKVPASWNGRPVVINHPQDSDGNYISANSPEVLEQYAVGYLFNTNVEDTKLKSEAWLEKSKLNRVSSVVAEALKNNEVVEVSIGVFTDNEEVSGTYNDEEYTAIARNHKPDHLALLPGGVGACSVEDGCGIRVNSSNQKGGTSMAELSAFEAIKKLNGMGFTFHEIITNKDGYNVVMEAIRRKIDSMDDQDSYHYLEEVYDDAVVYVKRGRENGGAKMYKQEYSINDDQVELTGVPQEVIKKVNVTYVANSVRRTKYNNNSKQKNMEKCTPCVAKKVDALIANGLFTEEDREFLQGKDEAFLDKLVPKTPTPAPVANTQTDPLAGLTPEQRAMYDLGVNTAKEKKTKLIQGIQANTKQGVWTEEVLNSMDDTMLQRIFDSVKKDDVQANEDVPMDFSLNGSRQVIQNNASEDVLLPVGIDFSK